MIYKKWAIIVELEEEDGMIDIVNEKRDFHLIKDWRDKFSGEFIAKNFVIVPKKYFQNSLKDFDIPEDNIKKLRWELELKGMQNNIKELPFYPLVSVILCNYNSSETIENSIKSIIIQTYKNVELIIIDDCSDDKSYEEICKLKEKYKDKISNFEVYKNETNMGVYYSRNFGIKKSKGDIIAIQDADDISDKNRLLISVNELIKRNVDFVLSNCVKICDYDKLSSISVAMATLVVKRDFYERYGYYDETTRHSGDLELLDRAYYIRYGRYEMDNFWYFLNYEGYLEGFYYRVYENLYYIGGSDNSITNIYKLEERMKYLMERRKIMKNKI